MARVMNRMTGLVGVLALAITPLIGCMPGEQAPPVKVKKSLLERASAPDIAAEDQIKLVAGNSAFAVDLYHELAKEKGNVFYSPLSVTTAMGMAYVGAKNTTADEIKATLHFDLDDATLHPALNWLDQELESRGQGALAADGKPFRLRVVNALWGQEDYTFLPSYLDALALNYGAGLNLMNFFGNPEGSRTEINQWVEEQTENRIQNLLPPGSITPDTRLVLTNAVYFNAAWAEPFNTELTLKGDFTTSEGTVVQADLMHQETDYGHAQGEGWTAVELKYDGNELSLVAIVPDAGTFDDFESTFDSDELDDVISQLAYGNVNLTFPKFEFTKAVSLKESLNALGMNAPFDEADFSGMDGTKSLAIGDVIHKAFVKLNENGTEAAAATAITFTTTSEPPPATIVKVDRPFIFAIRDLKTGTIVFMGRISDPTAK